MIIELITGLTKSGKVRKVKKVMTREEIERTGLINVEGNKYVSKENYEGVVKVMNIKVEKEIKAMESYVKYVKESVDKGIKYAIKMGKDAKVEVKFVSAKQLDAIFKSYKEVVGFDMTDEQKMCIKTLNPKQISNVLHTLNTSKKQFIACKELQELQNEFKGATGNDFTKKEIYELSKMSKIERLSYIRYTKKLALA